MHSIMKDSKYKTYQTYVHILGDDQYNLYQSYRKVL